MQKFPDPLIIFHSFAARDSFERGLGLQKQSTDPTEIEDGTNHTPHLLDMYTYRSLHGTTCSLYLNVCRAPGGQTGFLRKAAFLYEHFEGPVFVFHRELPAFAPGGPQNVFINYDIQSLLDVLRISGVSDAEKARMAEHVGAQPPASAASGGGGGGGGRGQRRRLFTDLSPPQQPQETLSGLHLNLEPLRTPPLPRTPAFGGGPGEDADLLRAIRLSEEEHARFLAAQKPPPPKPTWQFKPPEKAEPGQPQCNVCFENRASICFPACGHQCICDACVQQLVVHECVVCRTGFEALVRPIVTLSAPPSPPPPEAAAGGTGAKRRKVTPRRHPAPPKGGQGGGGQEGSNKKEK